ncbi:MAG: hypothetical protein ACTSQ8_08040 [Candidatus Helarchaeota archaeon]
MTEKKRKYVLVWEVKVNDEWWEDRWDEVDSFEKAIKQANELKSSDVVRNMKLAKIIILPEM